MAALQKVAFFNTQDGGFPPPPPCDVMTNMVAWLAVTLSAVKMASFPEVMFATTKMAALYRAF